VSGTNVYHGVEYLTPTDFVEVAPGLTEPIAWNFNPTPSVSFGGGSGRAIPDVSTNGDPQTGYLVYSPSIGGLAEFGGTSFVDPQLNGSNAVIASFVGHRVGFWNPVMYGAVANGVNGIFTNINTAGTSNDNIFYTGNPGDEYNEGIGLGQPNLYNLAKIFSEILPF
jgi:kumamolisin